MESQVHFFCRLNHDPVVVISFASCESGGMPGIFATRNLSRLASHGLDGVVEFSYFRTSKGSIIHGVWEQEKASLVLLSGITNPEKVRGVQGLPWETLG